MTKPIGSSSLLGMTGLFDDTPDKRLGGLIGADQQDLPPLKEEQPLSNANGAPLLPARYSSAEDAKWTTMDTMSLLSAIDEVIGTVYEARLVDGKASLKYRMDCSEAMRARADLSREAEHKKRVAAKKQSFWSRLLGLVVGVLTAVVLAVAVVATIVTAGLAASLLLVVILAAAALTVLEKTIQLTCDEKFTIADFLCAKATEFFKWCGVSDEKAKIWGNILGSAAMMFSVIGMFHDPSVVGRLFANELKALGGPANITDWIETVMSYGATIMLVVCQAGKAVTAIPKLMSGINGAAGTLRGAGTLANVGKGAEVGGQFFAALCQTGVSALDGSAAFDTRDADKYAVESYRLQSEMKLLDNFNSVEADTLKRIATSFNDWRQIYSKLIESETDALRRIVTSLTGDKPVGA
ncbi:type III secretion system translocon subunit SctE [Bordetella sp. N]|uniref:type III secretion system translocon subunit SctE n=1 Tax=Bordetella sp. N TaxID=1746199 RepID=UPI00070EB253|nr:type III secretion system translocon subunit SctE [Bordetella sp. N]ALM86421.1 hypothetical protein ASB57_28920 [Bordetella sp. N]